MMGSGEVNIPTKTQKPTSTQEQPPSSPAVVYPDWASFQAYYNASGASPMPPPGFLHSPVASSPQGRPYMWSPLIISPYGTSPFVAMYPHGGIYPLPSIPPGSYPYSPYPMPSANGIAEASVAGASSTETDGKLQGDKETSSLKISRGNLLNMLTGKVNKTGKASGASANGVFSQSGENGSEGLSKGSDTNSQNVHGLLGWGLCISTPYFFISNPDIFELLETSKWTSSCFPGVGEESRADEQVDPVSRDGWKLII